MDLVVQVVQVVEVVPLVLIPVEWLILAVVVLVHQQEIQAVQE
jgi:hypothetical protein